MEQCISMGVFFSSIVGASLFGISLNKIAILPMEVCLLCKVFLSRKSKVSLNRYKKHLLFWYLIAVISTVTGTIFTLKNTFQYVDEIISKEILLAIQILFIYIPVMLLLPEKIKNKDTIDVIKKALITTGHVQAIWAFLQFVLYVTIQFDLNAWLFDGILAPIMRSKGITWTRFNNIAGIILIRPTGLNKDAAFLALILVVCFIFEKSNIWRGFYLLILILSISRSGLFTVMIYLIYKSFVKIKQRKKFKQNSIARNCFLVMIGISLFIFAYLRFPSVAAQMNRMIERISFISTGKDGTGKHTSYPIESIRVLFNMPWYNILLGIGVTISGVAFNAYQGIIKAFTLTYSQYSQVWAIECDFATVLIGTGIIGSFVYYSFYVKTFFKSKSEQIKEQALCMMIFGLMYNICGLTFVQFILWMLALSFARNKSEGNINGLETIRTIDRGKNGY